MAKITYKLRAFDPVEAESGKLCVMVKNAVTDIITNIDNQGVANPNYVGAGICRKGGRDTYTLIINNVTYQFDEEGRGITALSDGYKLMMGEANVSIVTSGNASSSSSTTTTTRGTDGSIDTKVDYSKGSDVMIDSLNARDEFAVHALRELLKHISDPSVLSDSEMNFYCNTAYRWAANMMEASANARGFFTQTSDGGSGSTESGGTRVNVDESSLSSNIEKLLNNVVAALERTKYAETDPISKVTIYSELVKLKYPELINFLNTYVKGEGEKKLGLKDLIEAISKVGVGGSTSDEISIGNKGLGRDKDNPIHISGGSFPTKDSLAAALDSTTLASFVTFNDAGAVGYSSKEEVKKAILGWFNYESLDALYTALEEKVNKTVDTRVKTWLSKTAIMPKVGGDGYQLAVPQSI